MLALTRLFSFALVLTVAIQSADASLVTTTDNASTSIAGPMTLNSGTDALPTATNSSDDCLVGLTESFVMVLGANPDFPEFYYGENGRLGWAATGIRPLEIRFEYFELEDLPYATNVFLDGTPVASIVFPPRYSLRPFAVIDEGRVYCGTISEDNVYLTAVPEPSVGISLLVGIGTLALLGMRRARRSQAG